MSVEIQTPYTVSEVAALTGLSERTITQIFEHEKGVIVYEVVKRRAKRKRYRTIRIPRHVYERVMRRYTVS